MRNFIIVGTQRTGSSALAELVGIQDNIACGWEWTLRAQYLKKVDIANRALQGQFDVLDKRHQDFIRTKVDAGTEWLGYRQLFRSSDKWWLSPKFSPALFFDRLSGFTKWFASHPDIHIIHIVRKDNLAWLASKSISKNTGKYKGDYNLNSKVSVNIDEGIKRLKSKDYVDHELACLANTNPYHRVYYEDFKSDNYLEANRVLEFLGCAERVLDDKPTKLKVQSQKQLSDSIENYNELEKALTTAQLAYSKLQA